jgi:hypothetical protein
VNSTLNSLVESRCPLPQLPLTAGSLLMYMGCPLGLGCGVMAPGCFMITMLVQPFPTTVGRCFMVPACLCGVTCLTVAPGGGVNVNCAGSGLAKLTWVNATSNAGWV